jgi:hypothetical protein
VPVLDVEGLDYMPQDAVNELKAEKTREFFLNNLPVMREVDGDKDGLTIDYL